MRQITLALLVAGLAGLASLPPTRARTAPTVIPQVSAPAIQLVWYDRWGRWHPPYPYWYAPPRYYYPYGYWRWRRRECFRWGYC